MARRGEPPIPSPGLLSFPGSFPPLFLFFLFSPCFLAVGFFLAVVFPLLSASNLLRRTTINSVRSHVNQHLERPWQW